MRTKTLLIAAAALAATIISTEAQTPVYSANVVGYASVVIPGNGQYTLLANPFDDGKGNYLTNVADSGNLLPKQSQVLVFDPVLGYTTIGKGGTPPSFPAGTTNQIPPGVGFFVRNGNVGGNSPTITNTFVGSVIVANGGSVTNDKPPGFTLQGSPIPFAGNIAIAGQDGGDTNLNFGGGLGKQSQILTFDPVNGFTTTGKGGTPPLWASTVTISVGQGFFINSKNAPDTNVVETLNLQ